MSLSGKSRANVGAQELCRIWSGSRRLENPEWASQADLSIDSPTMETTTRLVLFSLSEPVLRSTERGGRVLVSSGSPTDSHANRAVWCASPYRQKVL